MHFTLGWREAKKNGIPILFSAVRIYFTFLIYESLQMGDENKMLEKKRKK